MAIGVPLPVSTQTATLISSRGIPFAFSRVLLTTLQLPLGTVTRVATAVPRATDVALLLPSKR